MPRRSAASNKKIQSRKPTASNQKAQILALNKKVNDNSKKLEGVRYKVQHAIRIGGNITAAAPATPYICWALNRPSEMNQVFSAPDEAQGGKYNMDNKGRFFMDLNIVSNNEPSPLPLTVFIVRPKNMKVAVSAGINVAPSQGQQPLSLQSGIDFVNSIGLAMMNKKRWHIDKHWSINLGPVRTPITMEPSPTAWQGDLRPIRRSFRCPNYLKLNNRVGVWKDTLDYAVNPNQRQFLIVFNNNQGTSTSPTLNAQILMTAFTSE